MEVITTRNYALSLAEVAQNHKSLNLRVLDVTSVCNFADYFLIMSGTSNTHVRALADAVMEKSQRSRAKPEGYTTAEWVLVDAGDVVVHIFLESARSFYQLDKLWSHAPSVDINGRSDSAQDKLDASHAV